MKIKRPNIVLENLQVKSLESFKRLAKSVQEIEEQCGIHETKITIKNIFFCPWIDITKCRDTEMECLLIDLIESLKNG